MVDGPDMRFDIDALFDHMVNNLDHNMADELDWEFLLRSPSIESLERIADELENEFTVDLQDAVEHIHPDGTSTFGDPLLSIVRRAALTPHEVKALADRFKAIASHYGVTYDGVTCFRAVDEDELFGWLTLDDAIWRLRQFSDCGLEEGAELPWSFLVVAHDASQARSVIAELHKKGFDDLDAVEETDEDGNLATCICVFVPGSNDEIALAETCERIEHIAQQFGARLEGVQFFDRDAMGDLEES
ncbi:MAG TPA: ribonuclease E inhibitor RraB [Candidatus Hydrogenedentes bacterium]|nr:ribonuclease E inhibitor RraB [Candidatus Hydrogenedentota bacterium]